MEAQTPMMLQYERAKKDYPDALVFFRLGDFYEMFKSDAETASKILGLTLTQRQGVPMCGVPSHASQNYIKRLLEAGKTVALCDQVGPSGKGLVERRVTEVISPATILDDAYINSNEPNFILSISLFEEKTVCLAWLEISIGELHLESFDLDDGAYAVAQLLESLQPKEILIQDSFLQSSQWISKLLEEKSQLIPKRFPDWQYDTKKAYATSLRMTRTQSLMAFGIRGESEQCLHPVGPLLDFGEYMACHELVLEKGINLHRSGEHVLLDETCIRNLELVRNLRDGAVHHTLLAVLDNTKTPMGARLLKDWLLKPSSILLHIQQRLDAVEFYYHNQDLVVRLRKLLDQVNDVERLTTRLNLDRANPKDIVALGRSLLIIDELEVLAEEYGTFAQKKPAAVLSELGTLIALTLVDSPPYHSNEGGIIKSLVYDDLDQLRNLQNDSEAVLNAYLDEEKKQSGLDNLKLGHNRIIGHYFEISRAQSKTVPPHFVRKHSTLHAERFSTQRLQEIETAIDRSHFDIIALEEKYFNELVIKVKSHSTQLMDFALLLSSIDVLCTFAYNASVYGYVKPKVIEDLDLEIIEGRHPVVERSLHTKTFVANDARLKTADQVESTILLTGPNMAGKSTYLRQNALIVLMAHMGSFVPALDAKISLVDKIFCRVGASDNLSGGESTFLVEMNETASILRHATERSLIIMDEVGRGTSTQDGLAIAQAVLEFILERIGAKTFFATHFHELTSLSHKNLVNKSLKVTEHGDEVIFVKKVVDGAIDHSYGIHVASLAGIPREVTLRAQALLNSQLERPTNGVQVKAPPAHESSLFSPFEELGYLIQSFKVNEKTPLEALQTIEVWQKFIAKNTK